MSTANIIATDDAFIYEDDADGVQDDSSILYVIGGVGSGITAHTLLRFDTSSIPAEAIISARSLKLYYNTPPTGSHVYTVHKVLQDWIEGEVTWNSYSTGNPWSAAGGDYGTSLGSHSFGIPDSPPNNFESIDLSDSLDADILAGEVSLLIREGTPGDSGENAEFESLGEDGKPTLVITYSLPSSGTSPGMRGIPLNRRGLNGLLLP